MNAPMQGRPQPQRAEVVNNPRLTVAEHPLASDLLSILRDGRSGTAAFAAAATSIANWLLWETGRSLQTVGTGVPGFDGGQIEVATIGHLPAAVSILRAGEVFAGPFRTLFPEAPLYHIGVRRDEETLTSAIYSASLDSTIDASELWILDPMLATGGTVLASLERIRDAYQGPFAVVSLVAAPLGVTQVLNAGDDIRIVTAALDDQLNDQGYIVPGLGDAGDRYFGTASSERG